MEIITGFEDYWIVRPEDDNTGMCEIETVERGTDVPTRGYFIAYAYQDAAIRIAEQHNKALQEAHGH